MGGSIDLAGNWEYLYERSIGCVGILKEWLVRALSRALRRGQKGLERVDLESCALSVSQCDKMLTECIEGEMRMTENSGSRCRLRARLGLKSPAERSVPPQAVQQAGSSDDGRIGGRASDCPGETPSATWDASMPLDTAYDLWDLEMPYIPERSLLYCLKPQGIGTPQVESLSGYISRLAEAHDLSVGDLVGREPLSNARSGLYRRTTFFRSRPKSHVFHATSHRINGMCRKAGNWIRVFEIATHRQDLRWLTLISPHEGRLRHGPTEEVSGMVPFLLPGRPTGGARVRAAAVGN